MFAVEFTRIFATIRVKGGIIPTILPISDLRNYTNVLNQVDVDRPVYLTRNGRGTFVISRLDDYDKETTVENLLAEIKQGESSAKNGQTISIAEVTKKLGL